MLNRNDFQLHYRSFVFVAENDVIAARRQLEKKMLSMTESLSARNDLIDKDRDHDCAGSDFMGPERYAREPLTSRKATRDQAASAWLLRWPVSQE
jgi:hypothetical protein